MQVIYQVIFCEICNLAGYDNCENHVYFNKKKKKSHLKLLDQLELNVGDIVLSTKPSLN